MSFDSKHHLNEDGTVTLRIIPSNWHAFNITPDTYGTFRCDSSDDLHLDWCREEAGMDLEWDDFDWEYDHRGILWDLAEECKDWLMQTLMEIGLESASNPSVVDVWSPREYNFTSDGFEVEFTCDPEELRGLTADFDVDEWAGEYYKSRDGFISFVTSRLQDDEMRDQYDGEFRIEYLLFMADIPEGSFHDQWLSYMDEAEYNIMSTHTKVSTDVAVFAEGHHIPRVDDDGDVVRYREGEGWYKDDGEPDPTYYASILDYHRNEAKLTMLVEPVQV
jgi:hypothetical protein